MNLSRADRQLALDAFHELSLADDQRLQEVFERVEDDCRDAVVLKFPTVVLTVSVNPDNDTVEVRCQDAGSYDVTELVTITRSSPWAHYVGQTFGWGWIMINQQCYQDGVLLSFDGLEPVVAITAAASSLRVYSVNAIKREGN
jgi:hypothetical protein